MKNLYKICLILGASLTVSILIFIFSQDVLAQKLELEYPRLGNIPAPGTGGTAGEILTNLARYLYQFAIVLGTAAAVGFIIWGGFLYLTSLGNPARIGKAKNIAISAALGLIILFSSYVVLSSIDPGLVVLGLKPAPSFGFPTSPSPGPISPRDIQACQEIPLQKTFEAIHELEKSAVRTSKRIRLIILGDSGIGLISLADAIKDIKEEVEKCGCDKFQDPQCLAANSGSAQCPALCPAASKHPPDPGGPEDPCRAELRLQYIPALKNHLSRANDIISLLESHNLFDGLDNVKILELKEKIRTALEQKISGDPIEFEDFAAFFIRFLQNELNLAHGKEVKIPDEAKTKIREFLEKSLSAQIAILNNVARRLVEVRLDFERYKTQVARARNEAVQGTRNLFTCGEAKYYGAIKECRDLDFYHCP